MLTTFHEIADFGGALGVTELIRVVVVDVGAVEEHDLQELA